MELLKIHCPDNSYLNGFRPTYFQYILKGIVDSNIPLIEDNDLNKISYNKGAKSLFAMDFYFDTKKQRVWYDWSDFQRFVYPEVLVDNNDLYFKVECNEGHIVRYNIKPIGHGVTDIKKYFSNLNSLRNMKIDNYKYDIFGNFRATSPSPSKKSERITCCQKLLGLPYKSFLNVENCQYRPPSPDELNQNKKFDYITFLTQTKQSKINLMLPGIGELTWRISETLGMGACGLMPKLTTVLPGNPKNCWIEVKRDYSDLVEKVEYYLKNEKEREEIRKNGLKYYEEWLSPKAQINNILREIQKSEKML